MLFEKLFNFLIVTDQYMETSVTGQLISEITAALKANDISVKQAYSTADAKLAIESDPAIGCFLIEWGVIFQEAVANEINQQDLITYIREIGLEVPIYLITEKQNVMQIPVNFLEMISGCIFPQEQTPDLIASYVLKAFHRYIEDLKTPFFGGMIDYVEAGNDMWLAPGHNSGEFYRKSPVGRIFQEFLGENFFRADFNFVPDLGDIFGHTGPFGEAERQAAKIFGAERTYFVLNGTTTSNKIVNCATVAKGDLVLYDRNNHKSNVQSALMINGGIPIYLPDDRNSYGMVGPIDYSYLNEDKLRQLIKENPLAGEGAAESPRPFRVAIIENCTYDGTIYNVKTILDKIGHLCEYIFFDEAWGAFMAFHDIYQGRYALGLTNLTSNDPGIFVTQSTHKQLAGMSQASQIHVKDSHLDTESEKHRQVNHRRLNEVFMMHTSTSPFYPMFASLDVGAQMMKGKNGHYLWDEAIKLAIDIRVRIRQLRAQYMESADMQKRWFFDPFVPDEVQIASGSEKWENISTDELAREQKYWHFNTGDSWHGYTKIEDGYVMVDPTKMLLLTPGIDKNTGGYMEWGIPASVLASYLRDQGIVPEKSDFYSILFLVTPAIERSKAGKLLSELVKFKDLYDNGAPVDEVLPGIVKEHPEKYVGLSLKTLCKQIHAFLVQHDVVRLQKEMFASLPEIVMTPQDAQNALVANDVDYLPISKIDGRVAATLALSYPPGVAVVMPGERYGKSTQAQLDYFQMFAQMAKDFPGFENEIQGLYLEEDEQGNPEYYTYVVME